MSLNYQFFIKENLDAYIGEWIAICKNQIVAHGSNVKEVFKQAREKYPKEKPLVTRVPEKETMIFLFIR
ncbi:succinyl-CoA synthetase subunit alpha [Candidatus Woesearchaeota archaeon]|nr:succinyl-CoA synthetase subunit alpha [Candidatus Woesearchaeota archaeon]